VRFGRWYPLAAAAVELPDAPGLYQVRLASGLRAYPRGRSAMIEYGAAASLRAAAAALAAAHPGADWWCRVSLDPVADPPAALARLIDQFVDRFGAPPGPLA
jgi:hypothetical protein